MSVEITGYEIEIMLISEWTRVPRRFDNVDEATKIASEIMTIYAEKGAYPGVRLRALRGGND